MFFRTKEIKKNSEKIHVPRIILDVKVILLPNNNVTVDSLSQDIYSFISHIVGQALLGSIAIENNCEESLMFKIKYNKNNKYCRYSKVLSR